MVGDRLNTDILFGKNGGLATLLVLTGAPSHLVLMAPVDACNVEFHLGITKLEEITGTSPSPIVPDFVTDALGDLRIAASEV